MKRVRIIGGGFAGLSAAWALSRLDSGPTIEIYEERKRWGGFLESKVSPFGQFELAANGILNSKLVSEMFQDLDLEYGTLPKQARKRFIYTDSAKRWPLDAVETIALLLKIGRKKWSGNWQPLPRETLFNWAFRVGGEAFAKKIISPAVLGVYACNSKKLSATLVLKRLLNSKRDRLKVRGTLFPKGGMSALVEKLIQRLEERNVKMITETSFLGKDFSIGDSQILACSASAAAEILCEKHKRLAMTLQEVPYLPLGSVQLFTDESLVEGFAILFSEESKFLALGVLGDHLIFPGLIPTPSERWILGGDRQGDICDLSDAQIEAQVERERRRLGAKGVIRKIFINRWRQVVPLYDVSHEERLENLVLPERVQLVGNYMGQLGLSGILERSCEIAAGWSNYAK